MKKRVLSMLLAAVMLLSLFAGCGAQEEPPKDSTPVANTGDQDNQTPVTDGKKDEPKETVTLDWFVATTNSAQAYPAEGTLVEKVIFEKTGVKVNMTFGDNSTLSNMVAGEVLGDIITFGPDIASQPSGMMAQMVEEEMLYSYQELDAIYPGLLAACQPDVIAWWASPDGNTYGYPQSCTNARDLEDNPYAEQPTHVIAIRKDMWEALGSPDMTTPEGFLEACKRAEEEIGTYNGYDVIGFQCEAGVLNTIQFLTQYFSVPFENKDGSYALQWDTAEFKQVLQFLNEAYRMGLLRESNFSDTSEIIETQVAQGRPFAMMYTSAQYKNAMYTAWEADNTIRYTLPVLGNYDGQEPTLSASTSRGTMPTVVPKTTEHVEEIAKLLTFLISDEGQRLLYVGVEGETYHFNDQGKIERDFIVAEGAQYGLNTMWPLRNVTFFQRHFMFNYDAENPDYIRKWDMNDYAYDFSTTLKYDVADERAEDMNELRTQIGSLAWQAYGPIITAKTADQFETLYAQMLKDLDDAGLATLRAYDNEAFQRAKKDLGVEHLWPHY